MSLHAQSLFQESAASVPLQRVEAEASLQDLLVEVSLTQVYRNTEAKPVEAVFSFPVPRDATLLDVRVALGDKDLTGQVVARGKGRERYENAVTDGDTAVLLEELEPGLYHMSLGNLQAGETAIVRYRYAQLLYWQQGLRFALPTALAPRYGDPAASGLDAVQVPAVDLLAEYPFSFRMQVRGRLAEASVESPSHGISVAKGPGTLEIALAGPRDTLDRDLVLNFALAEPLPPAALVAPDGDKWVGLVSLPLPEHRDFASQAPRCIPILVDCSGSMGGDSIAQARHALGHILDALRPQDHFNIIRFGSHVAPLFPAPRPVTAKTLAAARRLLAALDADLGGTEIGRALERAHAARLPDFTAQDLLLITDGEVWNAQAFVERARAAGDRIFTVGVGHAVSEAFLRDLAEQTGGACELVAPSEAIAERIERHFRRIYQPRLASARIDWPLPPERQSPGALEGAYLGDTLHVFAWFDAQPEGQVRFTTAAKDGTAAHFEARLQPPTGLFGEDLLPRLAARAGLKGLPEAEQAQVAERYQLLTDQTAWLIVAERPEEERSDGLPALRKVPHMLAAGWGGSSALGVRGCKNICATDRYTGSPDVTDELFALHDASMCFDSTQETQPVVKEAGSLADLAQRFSRMFQADQHRQVRTPTLAHLEGLGIPHDCIAELIRLIVDEGQPEAAILTCFLATLLGAYRASLPRHGAQRILRVYEKQALRLPEDVRARVQEIAADCSL